MEILLRHDCTLHPEDARRNILLPFSVPKNYDRLAILLHYEPKEVYDPAIIHPLIEAGARRYFPPGTTLTARDLAAYPCLLNFVTLSLDCGDTYVGCAHRHAAKQTIIISPHHASQGFTPHAISDGLWRIVLHVHAVVSEKINYHVAVYGLEKEDGDDSLPSI